MSTAVEPRRRRLGIATQVFIGLGLGLLVGLFFGEKAAFLKVGGDVFIAALQITVIPYVVVALITSLGRLTLDQAKALGLKAGGVLLVLWVIGLTVVLLSPLAFPNWPSASFFSTSQIAERAPVDFLQLYIPSNIFASLAQAVVPAIVVFSILFGVALIRVEHKHRLVDLLTTVGDTLMTITGFIGRLAPYGVFAITASAAGSIDITELARLQVYIVIYVALSLLLSLWVIPALIASLTPLDYRGVLRAFRGPLVTAFATANLLIVLPVLAADGKRLIAETDGPGAEPSEQEESAIDILIPAAFPFPNLGLIMSLMFVLFGGWFVGSSLSPADYPTLAGAGLAGLFGGTILTLPFLFDLFRLPADLFQMFISVDVIAARFGTLLAGMHIIAIALIGAYAMQGAIRLRPLRLVRFAVVSLLLLVAVLLGIRAFYTYVFVAPFTKGDVLTSLPLLGAAQPHRVYRDIAEAPLPSTLKTGGTLARIRDSGVLRVCYRRSDYPSAFFNSNGELVGFDVEMTHRFARQLDARIEFVPVASIPDAEDRINDGYCDLFMSLMPIVPEMTVRFATTLPVLESAAGLLVEDYRRRAFQTWDGIRALGNIRVATSENRATQQFLRQELPDAKPVIFKDTDDINELLKSDPLTFDALLLPAEEGAAWTIRFPRFNLVTPSPILLVPFGYALRPGDAELLNFLNAWLLNAKGNGTIDALYRYWMLGELDEIKPPRWSIAQDVLGWFR
jgi:Na+/H+-dicarboxylate symporter/ABC-type amino acid transport substrate-binding protein